MEPTKDRRDRSDLWASPPPPPPELVVVDNYVPGAAAAPAAEGLWVVRRHPFHGAASYLVIGSSPGSLVSQRREGV